MQHPAFVRKTYDETLGLMVEARNYLIHVPSGNLPHGDAIGGLRQSCEAMRVTARLTSVMAWLMMQRAAAAGEIAEDEALGSETWLGENEVCLDSSAPQDLPTGLLSLLERSLLLYVRVARIEARLRLDQPISRESRRAGWLP